MVQIEALRLLILGIDDERVNGDLGPPRALYRIPQEGASEFPAVPGDGYGKATQTCDGYGGIAWQTFRKPDRQLREGYSARG